MNVLITYMFICVICLIIIEQMEKQLAITNVLLKAISENIEYTYAYPFIPKTMVYITIVILAPTWLLLRYLIKKNLDRRESIGIKNFMLLEEFYATT